MKKKINIILIFAVLALWGTVGYRYLKNYFFVQENINDYSTPNFEIQSLNIQRDTFAFTPLHRDPFLGKTISVSTINSSHEAARSVHKTIANKSKPKAKPAIVIMSWPDIKYHGYIKSGKNLELAIIKIDGKLVKMHKGEVNEGLLIKDIYKDSITVVFNNGSRTYKHSK